MPKTRTQKQDLVIQLKDKLSKAKSVVFADYKGLKMSQLSILRKDLRDQKSEFTITKNSLLKLALSTIHHPPSTIQLFEGPIATLFSYDDEITPIKTLVKALKDNQTGKVKAGIFEGEFVSDLEIGKLAALPSKQELKVQVVGSLGAPLYGIVGVLQANLRNLVYVLDQIKNSKGGDAQASS